MLTVVARLRRRRESAVQSPARHSPDVARASARRRAAETGVFGMTVAVVGELSEWPDRGDVRAVIGAVGGRYLEVISHQVDVVVLGSPADDDDAAAATIRRARKMVDAGLDVQIIDEAEFIALIGLPGDGPADPLMRRPAWAGQSRGWGPPVGGVVDTDWHVQEFVRLLGPRRPGGYVEPREVVLFRHELGWDGVELVVVCRGLVVGCLAGAAAAQVAEAMEADFLDQILVPGVLYGGATGDAEGFCVGVWPELAAASGGLAAALSEIGSRVEPWPPSWNRTSSPRGTVNG